MYTYFTYNAHLIDYSIPEATTFTCTQEPENSYDLQTVMILTLLWLCGTNLQCLQGVQSPGQGGEENGHRKGLIRMGGLGGSVRILLLDLLKETPLPSFLMYTVQG